MKNSLKLDTQLIIAGRDKRYTQGAVNPVIQRASSLVFETVKDKKVCYRQSRQRRAVLWPPRDLHPFRISESDE